MKDEIKEILECLSLIARNEYVPDELFNDEMCQQLLYYIINLQEENERLTRNVVSYDETLLKRNNEYEVYKSRCENAQDLILNELSHLKANDEETWNKEFYDENNKLDYRKLCIELLNQVINLLDGGDDNE